MVAGNVLGRVPPGSRRDFRILGPLEAIEAGRQLKLGGPKQRALLAVLLLHRGETVSRDVLVDALWGEDPPATSVKAVQVHVSNLRQLLGEHALLTRAQGYLLDAAPEEVDRNRFEMLVAAGRRARLDGDHREAVETLKAALRLWRGPPLADFADLPFAQGEIARLEEERLTAVEERIEAQLALGEHHTVTADLEALVAAHPLREQLHGRLMLALYRSGRQAEALEVYRRARERLVEELGLEPGRELQGLEHAILTQDARIDMPRAEAPHPASADAPAMPSPPLPAGLADAADCPLVGRTAERARLAAAWEEAAAGRTRLVLLEGEPGIGKTHLAAATARRAHADGALVLHGRCDEASPSPHRPWAEALGRYAEHAPADLLDRHVRDHGGALHRLVPPLARRLPAGSGAPARPDDPYSLSLAVAALLREAARQRPVVLVLDDLHWADRPSLTLLRSVLDELRDARLLLLATSATVPVDELDRVDGLERIALRGLAADDVAQLAEQLSGERPAPGRRARVAEIAAETGGNPMLVREFLRDPDDRGGLGPVPASARGAILRRAQRLGASGAELLGVAAVVGPRFALGLLAEAVGRPVEDVLAILEAGVVQSLLVESDEDPGRFAFASPVVHTVLYEQLGHTRRARLHRRVAGLLEEAAEHEPADLEALSRHWSAAGEPRAQLRAAAHGRQAADRALAAGAAEEAASWYERSLARLADSPVPAPRARCEILIGLGRARRQATGDGHRDVLLAAAVIAQGLNDGDLLAEALLAGGTGRFAPGSGDPDWVAALKAALGLLAQEDPRWPRVRAVLARELMSGARAARVVPGPAD